MHVRCVHAAWRLRPSRHPAEHPPPVRATHQVAAAPVQQVEVVVIHQVGRVQDALLRLRHMPEVLAAGRGRQVAVVQACQAALMALGRRGCLVLKGEDAPLVTDV